MESLHFLIPSPANVLCHPNLQRHEACGALTVEFFVLQRAQTASSISYELSNLRKIRLERVSGWEFQNYSRLKGVTLCLFFQSISVSECLLHSAPFCSLLAEKFSTVIFWVLGGGE